MTENLRQIGQRLKEYMQTRGLTITAVARMSTFSQKELDAMIDGRPYPVSRLMPLLALFEDVNPQWLLRGEAPMLLKGTPKPKRELSDDIEAREVLRRHAAQAPKTEAATRIQALETEIAALRRQVADLTAHLGSR